MADTMQFDLVSPEQKLASLQVASVQIPGADGQMTAMPNHAPVITTLRPGVLHIAGPEGEAKYAVTGGFAEVSPEGCSVLAEKAIAMADASQADLEPVVAAAREAAANAASENRDMAELLLADLEELLQNMV
ncbi:F0F1 ATP synthase subunit epsilon [Lentibacter algarum]|uniref:F0F1 ATP synthase subunit epsilon n=1 Tax=Lentibacter algarum TaxID=576131 RepID=UPI001C067FB3|nr:F0F1 ATP synthase subunit epsilon [Lentibacter algarum]MBU2980959.1 F0F1 ATP synthase subunit epsilon [Lentibacter algarum]